jgi:phage anti-repressor protein
MEQFLKRFSDVPNGFIQDFFDISKESCSDDDPSIDFDVVVEWLDVRKDNLKRLLVKNFELNYDYTITEFKRKNSAGNGTNYVEVIFLTPDCFKELCMLSQTAKAKQVRKYYLSIEKLVKRYHENIQTTVYKELGLLKTNQRPKINKRRGVIYILKALNSTVTLYKIGKTNDLKKRLRAYNSGNANDTEPIFVLEVNDIDKVESCIKLLTKNFKYRKYKEVYEIDFNILKSIYAKCANLIEGVDEQFKKKNKTSLKKKIQQLDSNECGLFAYISDS